MDVDPVFPMYRFCRTPQMYAQLENIPGEALNEWSRTTVALREVYDRAVRVLVTEFETAPAWPRMWYVVRAQQAAIEYLCNARAVRDGLSIEDRAHWRWMDDMYTFEPVELFDVDPRD